MHELAPQNNPRSSRTWLPTVAVGLAALAAYWMVSSKAKKELVTVNIDPIDNFEVERFVGDWYEIARIEHGVGKPLTRSRVEYEMDDDGSLSIVSRGFHTGTNRWVEARGTARFVGSPNFGAMKASFFGPFYEGYHIVAIDADYQWAMVMGDTADSFRLLSRKPVLDGATADRLVYQAEKMGVEADRIHWVMQDGVNPTGLW